MRVYFKPSFIKDFKKLPYEIQREVRSICAESFPKISHIRNFLTYEISPIKGFKDFFRIKVGEHRIGFKTTNGSRIEFMRVKHSKDIYKYFP